MAYVEETTDTINNMQVQQWVELLERMPVSQYVRKMRATTLSQDTWGGFLEAVLWCQAWGRGLGCAMLELREGGWQVLACVGSTNILVCIGWNGSHWVRVRLTATAANQVRAWSGRDPASPAVVGPAPSLVDSQAASPAIPPRQVANGTRATGHPPQRPAPSPHVPSA